MTKIVASDFDNAIKVISNALDNALSANSNISNGINSFNTTSTKSLKGRGYDCIRNKLSMYINAYSKEKNILENAKISIVDANNSLHRAMEGYTELDDSKIVEAELELAVAERYIAWLKRKWFLAILGETNAEHYNINIGYYENTVETLKKYIALLKNIPNMVSAANAILEPIQNDILNIKNIVDQIQPSNYV